MENVFAAEVIIQYTATNWVVTAINALTGSRVSQSSTPAGNFLSTLSHDDTGTGSGTPSDPFIVTNARTGITQNTITKTNVDGKLVASRITDDGSTINFTDWQITGAKGLLKRTNTAANGQMFNYYDSANIKMGFGVDMLAGTAGYESDMYFPAGLSDVGTLTIGTIGNSDGTTYTPFWRVIANEGRLQKIHMNGSSIVTDFSLHQDTLGDATKARGGVITGYLSAGIGDSRGALKLSGITGDDANAAVVLDGYKNAGAIGDTVTLIEVRNAGVEKFSIKGNGDVYTGGYIYVPDRLLLGNPFQGDPLAIITRRFVPEAQGNSASYNNKTLGKNNTIAEKTELIIANFNDNNNDSGPDRITLRAPVISFQTFNSDTVGDINNNSGWNERLNITPDGYVDIALCNFISETGSSTGALHIFGRNVSTEGVLGEISFYNSHDAGAKFSTIRSVRNTTNYGNRLEFWVNGTGETDPLTAVVYMTPSKFRVLKDMDTIGSISIEHDNSGNRVSNATIRSLMASGDMADSNQQRGLYISGSLDNLSSDLLASGLFLEGDSSGSTSINKPAIILRGVPYIDPCSISGDLLHILNGTNTIKVSVGRNGAITAYDTLTINSSTAVNSIYALSNIRTDGALILGTFSNTTKPASYSTGALIYNSDLGKLQYFSGSWITIG